MYTHTHTHRMISSTPAAKYDQRQNRGGVVCTLNDALLPHSWRGTGARVTIDHYDPETALKAPYQYMFQKVSEKSLSKLQLYMYMYMYVVNLLATVWCTFTLVPRLNTACATLKNPEQC